MVFLFSRQYLHASSHVSTCTCLGKIIVRLREMMIKRKKYWQRKNWIRRWETEDFNDYFHITLVWLLWWITVSSVAYMYSLTVLEARSPQPGHQQACMLSEVSETKPLLASCGWLPTYLGLQLLHATFGLYCLSSVCVVSLSLPVIEIHWGRTWGPLEWWTRTFHCYDLNHSCNFSAVWWGEWCPL